MTQPTPSALTFVSLLSPHLHDFYTKLLAHLSHSLGMELRLVQLDWQEARGAVEAATVDGAFQCGLILQRHPAFVPVAAPVASGETQAIYTTQVVVRREHHGRQFEDLAEARWAYNDPSSLSGYVALQAHASRLALPPEFFGSPLWSGSHLASLGAMVNGHADAAGIDSTVYSAALRTHPELRQSLRVVTTLGPYPAPPLTLLRTLPQALHDEVQTAVLELHTQARGQLMLAQAGFGRFLAVDASTYQSLQGEADRAEHWQRGAPVPGIPQRFTHA